MPRTSPFTIRLSSAEQVELQREIYFSIIPRKVVTPNDFPSLEALAERLLDFQYYWEAAARPFEWKFTRDDLAKLLTKLEIHGAS